MANFKFKMDFLIKIRRHHEEKAMARLAQRRASIKELEEEIFNTEYQKNTLLAELANIIKTGRISPHLLKMYKDYDHKLAKDLARLKEFLQLSRREEAKEQAALTQASIDRKIIEKLKEKKKAEFMEKQAYIEQNILEEMAALAKARREREEKGVVWGGGND